MNSVFRLAGALLALLALCPTSAAQPMLGTYTVGPTGQYTTFQAAVDAVALRDVAGPVLFLVPPGNYVESFTLKHVPSASAANTITFRSIVPRMAKLTGSRGPTITVAMGSSAMMVSWYVLDALEFTGGPGPALYMDQFASDFEIKNCEFKAGHTQYLWHLRGLASSAGSNVLRFNVHSNKFTLIPGAVGFYLQGPGGWLFHKNEIDLNGCTGCFYLINYNNSKNSYHNNIIHGALRDTASSYVFNMTLSQYDIDISNNTFIVDTGTSPARIIYGGGCCTTRMIYVYSNLFVNLGNGPCLMWNNQGNLTAYYRGDGNLFFRPGATPVVVGMVGTSTTSGTPYDFTNWKIAAAGYDTLSVAANPLLFSLTLPDIRFAPGSPARDAGVPSPGSATFPAIPVTEDFFNTPRGAKLDIGAYELPGTGFFTYGTGCPGSGSLVPAIGHTGTAAIGSTNFAVTATNGLGGAPALLVIGSSNASWLGVPLPLALGGGCNLYQSITLALGFGLSGTGAGNGAVAVPLAIPNDPALAGGHFFLQWLVIDPMAPNGFGICTTQAGRVAL